MIPRQRVLVLRLLALGQLQQVKDPRPQEITLPPTEPGQRQQAQALMLLGEHSTANGENSKATGEGATATRAGSSATGNYSTDNGEVSTASDITYHESMQIIVEAMLATVHYRVAMHCCRCQQHFRPPNFLCKHFKNNIGTILCVVLAKNHRRVAVRSFLQIRQKYSLDKNQLGHIFRLRASLLSGTGKSSQNTHIRDFRQMSIILLTIRVNIDNRISENNII